MIAIDCGQDWAFSLDVAVTSIGVDIETYTNAEVTPWATVAALQAWLNDAARPWTLFMAGSKFAVELVRYGTTGEVRCDITCAPQTFTLDGGAIDTLGLDADTYVSTAYGIQGVTGTWDPKVPIAVTSYARTVEAGDADGAGATRPGSPGRGHYLPRVEAICTASEAAYLSQLLISAVSPRTAYIYQEHTGATLHLALGEIQRSRADLHYRMTMATAGVPV